MDDEKKPLVLQTGEGSRNKKSKDKPQLFTKNEELVQNLDLHPAMDKTTGPRIEEKSRKNLNELASLASHQGTRTSQQLFSLSSSSPISGDRPESFISTVSLDDPTKYSSTCTQIKSNKQPPELGNYQDQRQQTQISTLNCDSQHRSITSNDEEPDRAGVESNLIKYPKGFSSAILSSPASISSPLVQINTTQQHHKPRSSSDTHYTPGKDAENFETETSRLFTPGSKMEYHAYKRDEKRRRDSDVSKKNEKIPFFVYYLACFATIGGLLFGYDTGIVSGSMLLIKDYFKLSTTWQEIIVSATVGSAALFSLIAGFTCDYFGRKVTIMAACVVFVGGAVIMGASENKEMLLAGRFVVGIGIGFASMTVPIYVAEASPSSIRGRLVTLNQLFITIGIVISSVVAGAFSEMKETGWRYMLGLAGIPGIIQFIGFLYLPESPRWLVMKGKDEEALAVLQRIRGHADVQDEVNEIKEAIEDNLSQQGFVLGRVVRTPHVLKALIVGCGLQVFQQLCGINTVIYYSATILRMAGFSAEAAIWLVMVPNGINFLTTVVGVALVERLGRKILTVASFLGVIIALAVLAVGFQLSANFSPSVDRNLTESNSSGTNLMDGCYNRFVSNCEACIEDSNCGFCYSGSGSLGSCLKVSDTDEDKYSLYGRCQNETLMSDLNLKFTHGYCPTDYTWMSVLGLALFVMAFAPGLGPMPWTINSEIYPMWARSTCNSLATGCNWICNLLVSLFFLTLTEKITKYGAFWLFACVCFTGMVFTIAFLPETKNKTLEEVEELFKGNKEQGSDNLGYEKEISPSSVKSNTKL